MSTLIQSPPGTGHCGLHTPEHLGRPAAPPSALEAIPAFWVPFKVKRGSVWSLGLPLLLLGHERRR